MVILRFSDHPCIVCSLTSHASEGLSAKALFLIHY